MRNIAKVIGVAISFSMLNSSLLAAQTLHLTNLSIKAINHLFFDRLTTNNGSYITVRELKREVDFNQTLHIFLQQTFQGYDIVDSNATIHLPNGDSKANLISVLANPQSFMTGIFYQRIQDDLREEPSNEFSEAQKNKALQSITKNYSSKKITNEKVQLVVYIDSNQKAHWAFAVKFDASDNTHTQIVSALLDAKTFKIYKQNNEYQINETKLRALSNHHYESVLIGGVGGNTKTGIIYYDGLDGPRHRPALLGERDPITKTCYLQDQDITVRDWNHELDVVQFHCEKPNPSLHNVYWDRYVDPTNGALNPAFDVLYAAEKTRNMFQEMYETPLWKFEGKPVKLNFFIHDVNTGFWDGAWFSDPNILWYVSISDGDQELFPRVALDTLSALIGQGYKASHSFYAWGDGPAVGTCFAFKDFFGKAVEFYTTKTNVWSFGSDVVKAQDKAIRYLDNPTRDCDGRKAGDNCSIDNVNQVSNLMYVEGQYAAGVLNKALYSMTKYSNWDTKKIFQIMLQAFSIKHFT